jgi:hypothetical protein
MFLFTCSYLRFRCMPFWSKPLFHRSHFFSFSLCAGWKTQKMLSAISSNQLNKRTKTCFISLCSAQTKFQLLLLITFVCSPAVDWLHTVKSHMIGRAEPVVRRLTMRRAAFWTLRRKRQRSFQPNHFLSSRRRLRTAWLFCFRRPECMKTVLVGVVSGLHFVCRTRSIISGDFHYSRPPRCLHTQP